MLFPWDFHSSSEIQTYYISLWSGLIAGITSSISTGVIVGIIVNNVQSRIHKAEINAQHNKEKEELFLSLIKLAAGNYVINPQFPETALFTKVIAFLEKLDTIKLHAMKDNLSNPELAIDELILLSRDYDAFLVYSDSLYHTICNYLGDLSQARNQEGYPIDNHAAYVAGTVGRIIKSPIQDFRKMITSPPRDLEEVSDYVYFELLENPVLDRYLSSRNSIMERYNKCVGLLKHYYSMRPELFDIRLLI